MVWEPKKTGAVAGAPARCLGVQSRYSPSPSPTEQALSVTGPTSPTTAARDPPQVQHHVIMKTKRCSLLEIIFALIKIFIEFSQMLSRNSFGKRSGVGIANKRIQPGSSPCWSAVGWYVTNIFPETNLICWRSGQKTGVLGFASGQKH